MVTLPIFGDTRGNSRNVGRVSDAHSRKGASGGGDAAPGVVVSVHIELTGVPATVSISSAIQCKRGRGLEDQLVLGNFTLHHAARTAGCDSQGSQIVDRQLDGDTCGRSCKTFIRAVPKDLRVGGAVAIGVVGGERVVLLEG